MTRYIEPSTEPVRPARPCQCGSPDCKLMIPGAANAKKMYASPACVLYAKFKAVEKYRAIHGQPAPAPRTNRRYVNTSSVSPLPVGERWCYECQSYEHPRHAHFRSLECGQ